MTPISFEASIELLNHLNITPKTRERLFILDALGRTNAKDIKAAHHSPKYPLASMDGYAILAEDQGMGCISLLDGDNPAGNSDVPTLTSGFAIKTFTGARMPHGANALIPIEYVTAHEDSITINQSVHEGFSIQNVGENFKKDEILLAKGTTIDYAAVGVLSSLGYAMVDVIKKPHVAILATGSEILDIGACGSEATIYSSNSYTLAALAQQAGAQVVQRGVIKDDYEAIKSELLDAMHDSDMVVTTGGASVGDYDYIKAIIDELGAVVIFNKVLLKPGQHVILAQLDNTFILGLPGFAYSSTVTFMLYGVPLIKKFLGQKYSPQIVQAILDKPYEKTGTKTQFVACNLRYREGAYRVDFKGKKSGSSGILTNMLNKSALMMLDEKPQQLKAGDSVDVMVL